MKDLTQSLSVLPDFVQIAINVLLRNLKTLEQKFPNYNETHFIPKKTLHGEIYATLMRWKIFFDQILSNPQRQADEQISALRKNMISQRVTPF